MILSFCVNLSGSVDLWQRLQRRVTRACLKCFLFRPTKEAVCFL
uniref:Uncharacterized protein n=1 Tax=Rhizophora mucronata TaxID=61149 RepID=A0A2P2R1L1_RHIMU